ncbi:MAG: YceI family protein [Bacteroidales bacterium]
MKNISKIAAILMIAGIATACSSGGGETTRTAEAVEKTAAEYDVKYQLNLDESMLAWEGYKPTGQHHGTVSITDGKLKMKDGILVGGKFTFEMNSITVLDLTDPDMNGKLTGHLKSADFFEVEAYPEATFEITGIEAIDGTMINKDLERGDIVPTHAITGNLTMKDITKSITFNAKVDMMDDMLMAESNMFFLDRTEWNVMFKSQKLGAKFKDDFINDEMGIQLRIMAAPKPEETASL